MSQDTEVNREGAEVQPGVRLRVPERRQMAMVVQCPDDLVPAQHAGRMGMALGERRVATRPIRGCWWGCGCTRVFAGSDRRGSWRGGVRRARHSAGCAAG